jgi:glycine/D-amino acid oxidase-like deaminating enzyme
MTPHSRDTNVIVIGGGVIGCAIAYFLAAEHGARPLVIERNGVGSEASGGAAGELAAMERAWPADHEPQDSFTRFMLEGISLHQSMAPTLLEESGIDYLLRDIPMLRPAFSAEEVKTLRSQLTRHQALGVKGDWIEPENIDAMHSWLAPDVLGAIYSIEYQLEAYLFAIALAQAAEQHGVQIRSGEVTGIQQSRGRVTGVSIGHEVLNAPLVVIANGPWARQAGAWVGFNIPVTPLRGQIVHLDLSEQTEGPKQAIFHGSAYLLPKASGDLLAGTTIEDVGFNKEPTTDSRDAIMEAACRIAPAVLDIPIKSMSACLRPYSGDGNPIIGTIPGIDGLYVATGHGFKGITLSLITGKSLAQAMMGHDPASSIEDFSPSRFSG